MNLGIVARADLGSGLQSQTYNLCRMLDPEKVLIIDSTPFNKAEQHFELYEDYRVDKVYGFPNNNQYLEWLRGLTHVLTAETFYNDWVVPYCSRHNIKTYIQPNFEFSDYIVRPMTAPTKFLMPSYWMLERFKNEYPNTAYLPPPIISGDFQKARTKNMNRIGKPRFLHIVGKWASKDRNGTKSIIEALRHTDEDFELVIKSQAPLEFTTNDPRIVFDVQNVAEQQDLYMDFDALIIPRRYGGLCLPMQEALMSALPVIMTDISPNNKVLPDQWLVKSEVHDKLMTRMMLDVYNADPVDLASTIDWLCHANLKEQKAVAFSLGTDYSDDNLREKYQKILNDNNNTTN